MASLSPHRFGCVCGGGRDFPSGEQGRRSEIHWFPRRTHGSHFKSHLGADGRGHRRSGCSVCIKWEQLSNYISSLGWRFFFSFLFSSPHPTFVCSVSHREPPQQGGKAPSKVSQSPRIRRFEIAAKSRMDPPWSNLLIPQPLTNLLGFFFFPQFCFSLSTAWVPL